MGTTKDDPCFQSFDSVTSLQGILKVELNFVLVLLSHHHSIVIIIFYNISNLVFCEFTGSFIVTSAVVTFSFGHIS